MILTVLYPAKAGAKFDFDYYKATHTPLVKEVLSPSSVDIVRGVGAPGGGEPPFVLICNLRFASRAAMDAALASPRAADVFADVARFTDIEPVAVVTEAFS